MRPEEEPATRPGIATVDLFSLFQIAWAERLPLAIICGIAGIIATVYAFLAPEWYEAEILLAPTEDQTLPQMQGQFGGLANLVGLDMPDSNAVEAKAVLMSRDLTRDFIEDNQLLPVLLADEWDKDRKSWKAEDPEDWPDVRDAIEYFDESVRSITEDAKSGLVTLYIEWKDPVVAASWANELATRVNAEMRRRALRDAEANVEYLKKELESARQLSIQQSVSRVLERELQKLLLARGNEQFAFKILDTADVPKYPVRPQRILIVVTAILFSGSIGFCVLLVRLLYRFRISGVETD